MTAILALVAAPADAGGLLAAAGAGPALPLQADTASRTGVGVAGWVGWRAGLGPVHLRPDAMIRYTSSTPIVTFGLGGAATFGGPVAVGPYAHVGLPLEGWRDGLVGDAGLLAEVTVAKPLYVGVTAGWERTRDAFWGIIDCSASTHDCALPPYARNWLAARVVVGVAL